ncbi:23S rRNA (adenine(1618)-N(6))-methyltransferase RlmF [Rheinheimera sp.]|uniref:23S rRNA (adenine(1618)-N(6))-methyltransferase RlmF n=1 Tax=Rheinheimera sp. TaxID=1869214 RepID=UPI00404887D5
MSTPSLLHPRNAHHGRYDFTALTKAMPALTAFICVNPAGEPTIDFTDNNAVMMLNQALLAKYYKVKFWQLPEGYLCPPVPGRADYVHYLADLLALSCAGKVPQGKHIALLDIGTGANVIYPIIASHSYGWQVCGTETDLVALKSAQVIVASNPALRANVRVVQQRNNAMFSGVIMPSQRFHLTMCNPPFFASQAEAEAASSRKWSNLGKAAQGHQRNFAGQQHELWCNGGELAFISQMITESQLFKPQVCWFTSLVSQQKHLAVLQKLLRSVGAVQTQVIEMRQGQKVSRILAWSFLTAVQQQDFTAEIA